MRRLVASLPLAVLLAACSPAPAPPQTTAGQATPADATLGSAQWYAWVDRSLGLDDDSGRASEHGSAAWNQAVQHKLGQEAPQSKPGSPEWQQSVDALLHKACGRFEIAMRRAARSNHARAWQEDVGHRSSLSCARAGHARSHQRPHRKEA